MPNFIYTILNLIKSKNKSIYGIGAPSRASTLINYVGINENIIDYSYIEPSFNENINEKNRYIYIKTLLQHNYNVGDIIYIKIH